MISVGPCVVRALAFTLNEVEASAYFNGVRLEGQETGNTD